MLLGFLRGLVVHFSENEPAMVTVAIICENDNFAVFRFSMLQRRVAGLDAPRQDIRCGEKADYD